jgi:hypothetical protein
MKKVTCKVCSSRYKRSSERRTWRNRDREACKCEVCGTVMENWIGRGVVPVLMLVWRAWSYPASPHGVRTEPPEPPPG